MCLIQVSVTVYKADMLINPNFYTLLLFINLLCPMSDSYIVYKANSVPCKLVFIKPTVPTVRNSASVLKAQHVHCKVVMMFINVVYCKMLFF